MISKQIRYFSVLILGLEMFSAMGQTIVLEDCISKAIQYQASEKNINLIQQEQLSKNGIAALQNLPKLSIGAQATYQTQVTSINLPLPGIEVPTPTKDQYKLSLDLNQNIFDGGMVSKLKRVNEAMANSEIQQIKTEQLTLEEKVTQLYFNLRLLEQQWQIFQSSEKVLSSKKIKLTDQIQDGVASKGDLLQLEATLLELYNKQQENLHTRVGILKGLGILMGENLDPNSITAEVPTPTKPLTKIARPELLVILSRQDLLLSQQSLNNAKYAPKLGIFATGAYGRPGLNFLSNTFDFYALGGIQMKLPLEHLFLLSKSKEEELTAIQVEKLQLAAQNTESYFQSQIEQKKEEINKLTDMANNDQLLLKIRGEQTQLAEVKYQEGIITITEFTDAVENELQSKILAAQHSIQSELAIHQLHLLYGKKLTDNKN